MCGIAGVCFSEKKEQLSAVPLMRDALRHRGPDDEGIWFDSQAGVGLGHRRLAIVDLSSYGHQPMISASGRYVIVFNGEIYNFKHLKTQLEKERGIVFRGHSDTEVFLAGLDEWGMDDVLAACVGMFAMAVWDRQERSLYLVRDRFGEKPLYYGWINHSLVFASELKAFHHFPEFRPTINKKILGSYLRYSYIPAPYSIWEGIYKIMPGRYLKISGPQKIEEKMYWSAKQIVESNRLISSPLSYEEATDELEKRLKDAVALQMMADVPVGAFLSGGVDSSLITALMQAQSTSKVQTFSIGFDETVFNEAHYAKAVARHLGTEHTELYMTAQTCQDAIALFPSLYDEPFADSSQLPTWLVSKLAKEKVKVSLSGDGGDELFGGYQRYFYAQYMWNICRRVPFPVRKTIGNILHGTFGKLSEKLARYANLLTTAKERQDFYFSLTGFAPEQWLAVSVDELLTTENRRDGWLDTPHFVEWMLWLDTVTYLPDDLLTKVDRASMAVSLESRVPFLDHRVYEFASTLPITYKMYRGQGKRILRDILYHYVPKELIDRPKQGFGIPLGKWLRGPLRSQMQELLHHNKSLGEYWNVEKLKKYWKIACDTSSSQYDTVFWAVFVFQQWLSVQPALTKERHSAIVFSDNRN